MFFSTGKQPMVPFLDSEAIGDRPASRRGSLSCSTLPHLEPSSAYSSVNGFVCSDTLDKKVLLKNDSRWSTEDTKKSSYQSVSSFCSGGKPQSSPKIGSTWKSTVSIEPVYCDPTEVVLSISPPKHDTIEEHIYATLSERYASTTASDSDAKVAQKTNLIHSYNDSDDDSSSATTSASDDFEFHLTRPPVNTFRETPIKSLNYCSPNKAINNDKFKFVFDGNKDFMSVTDDYPSTTPSRASTLSIKSDHSSKDLQFMAVPLQIPIHSPTVREQHRNQLSSNGVNTLTKTQRNASLSMNDLDLLAKKQDEETEDIVYVLPGKSESTISLYRFSGGDFDETLDRPLVKCIRGRPTSSAQKPDIRSTELNCRHSLLDLLNDNQSTWESGTERGNVKKSNNTSPHTHKNNEQQFVNHAKPKNDIRTRKNLIDHPLLRKPRLYRSNAVPPNQAYNWKYRASVFPRQDFPWKKSPTRPFKMPVVSIVPGEPSSALYNYPISERHSSCSLNFTPMFNVQNAGRLSYQKKFVSDFL